MSFERELDFKVGNGLFRKLWVTAPSSTRVSDGLGPLFNARSCQSCHLKDGRGHPPTGPDDPAVGMFLRLSVPADAGRPAGDAARRSRTISRRCPSRPMAGSCRTSRCRGCRPRGGWQIELRGGAGDARRRRGGVAAPAELPRRRSRPTGRCAPDVQLSPRVAPQMIGLGLLEAVPEADILALADPGRRRRRRDQRAAEPGLVGGGRAADARALRLEGRAADDPRPGGLGVLRRHRHLDDAAAARLGRLHRGAGASAGRSRDGGAPEADDTVLDLVTFYSRNLAVPARRDPGDPQVLEGKRVFYEAGCAGCHQPKFVTDRLADQPEQSFQLIWPYTDLLLHDMGEGLADHRPEARASGTRVADGAALGDRADRDGDRAGELPARRAGADAARGGALARRRGAGGARHAWRGCRRPSARR